jgi:hypothetical protein
MLNIAQTVIEVPKCSIARCPNCDRHSQFTYKGQQHWSERVAKAAGMTQIVHFWMCDACQTTIVTPDISVS